MKLKISRYSLAVLALVAIAILQSCASQQAPRRIFVFPGLDTTTVALADSLARGVFIDWEQEQLAMRKADSARVLMRKSDTLWARLQAKDGQQQPAPEDTLSAIAQYNQGIQALDELAVAESDTALSDAERVEMVREALLKARSHLEEAIALNPFDEQARFALATVYEALAQRFLQDHYWGNAAEVLLLLTKMNGGQHVFYARLGECFANLNAWQEALTHYRQAESVLRQTAAFQVPESQPVNDETVAAAIDSSALFLYVYYQMLANMRLNREDSAKVHFARATELTASDQHRSLLNYHFGWASWDAWNLASSEMRDSLEVYSGRNDFKKAADGYRLLLKNGNLRTRRARQEVKWRLANLEFRHLGLQDSAIVHMKQIMDFYRHDSVGMALAQTDTLYQQYRDAYGVMCYNTGLAALEIPDREKALPYFLQALSVPWSYEAKAHLEVAKLLLNDPARTLPYAEQAYRLRSQLTTQELHDTLRILVQALRRTRNFEEARKYQELLHEVRQNND